MINEFFSRHAPVYQAPDAPSSPAPAGASGTPSPVSTPSPAESTTGTSSPSATPSPSEATSTPASTEGVDSSFDFMFNPTNEDPLEGLGLPAKGPEASETPTVQPTPAKPEPVVQTTSPAPVTPSPAPAQTEATSPQTPSASLDPYDPGALAQHLATNEEQAVQYAAEHLFKLSPKDVEDLESDVVGTIPRLLARTLVASQRNFLMQLSQLVPTMIQRQGEVTKAHTQAVGEFYTRWPEINAVKDANVTIGDKNVPISAVVQQYASVFRQMHPQASRQDAIEAVGPMVMMAARIAPGQTSQVAPARPSPMVPANGRPPQPTPFMPAGPSAGGASHVTAPQMSPVEAMFADTE